MNWDDYEAFCQVAAHSGFTAAAQATGRPKSSLSEAVNRLEAALQLLLLERTTRVVRLTDAGETLYRNVEPLFQRLREAHGEVLALKEQAGGVLRVAAPYEFSAHHLGDAVCRLLAGQTDLRVEITMAYTPVNPVNERYDIVFSMVDRELPDSSIIARRVFTLGQGVFAAPELLETHGVPAEPADLANLPVIAALDETEWHLSGARGKSRAVPLPAPRLRSANASVRRLAAIAGIGVARITATYCEAAVTAGDLVRLFPDYDWAPIPVYALFPTRRLMPAKVRLLLDALEAHFGGG